MLLGSHRDHHNFVLVQIDTNSLDSRAKFINNSLTNDDKQFTAKTKFGRMKCETRSEQKLKIEAFSSYAAMYDTVNLSNVIENDKFR